MPDASPADPRFAAFFYRSPESVVLLDPHDTAVPLRIVDCNDAAARLRGCTREAMIGRSIYDFSSETADPARLAQRLAALRAGETLRGEDLHRRPDGTSVPVEYSSTLVEYQGHEYIIGVARDVSERHRLADENRRIEERLREVQRLESLGLLAGGVAHDFNNLLTTIAGHGSLAAAVLADGHPARAHLAQIDRAVETAADICRQLLAFSGRGHFTREPLDAGPLVRDLAQLLHVSIGRNTALVTTIEPGLPAVAADRAQLRQVVLNLVLNAAEAIGPKLGRIEVHLRTAALPPEWFESAHLAPARAPAQCVVLSVTDDGPGIDPATSRRIFEPFFSSKAVGRGLGLAAVLGIVRGHEGALRLTTSPGRGSCFEVALPALALPAPAPAPAAPPPTARAAHGEILVIDDDDNVRFVTASLLTRFGFTVHEAATGPAGLDLLRTHPDIRAAVVDLTMPGIDGHSTAEALRTHRPELPILLISGYSAVEASPHLAARAPTQFLQKPYPPGTLRLRLNELLSP